MIEPERAQQIAELVKSALECPLEERDAFLAQACADDPEIRGEVDSFLQFQSEASQFIEEGALRVAAQTLAREPSPSPQQIEGYQILSRIGIGGMGEVYFAQETKLRRKVALKLVRAGMDSAEIVARFRHEEQILASLNHPNIAQLYGAGVAAGDIPFFAMEYVEGVRLDEYCNAHTLSTSARLQLFRKVCAAVHYAHQRLVIHRDLKPSNILVTSDGEPKLLDFGIAKVVEGQDGFTQMQTLPGAMTPDYASPEQVRGEAMTTSSDVYSLGVLLYEILTGRRPYRLKTRSAAEIAQAITDQEPERPSTTVAKGDGNSKTQIPNPKLLRGDLDNIVLMALRKEPPRRYASVEQFSEDIRRHLEGRPVIAHKDTIAYRAAKFVKRQKLGVAAALLILSTLIAAVILTSREQRRAERRFNDVRQLSNALLFEIAPKIERLEGSTEAREALVRRALEYLDSLGQESGDDAQLQSELAAAYEKVGEIQGAPRKPNLSNFSGALLSYGKARTIRQKLLERRPGDFAQRKGLAANYAAASFIREWTSDITGALADSKSALDLYEELIAARPDSGELKIAASEAQMDLATIHYFNDQTAEVYPPLRKALATLETLQQADPGNTEVLRLLSRGYTNLAMNLFWDKKEPEAHAEMEKAFALNKSLLAAHPKDNVVRQASLYTWLQASQLTEDSNPARSFEILIEALKFAEESVQHDAANIQARQNHAKVYSMLGVIALRLQKLDEAVLYLEKSAAAFAELEKLDPKNRTYKDDVGRNLIYLGQSKHLQKNFPEALVNYERAVAIYEHDAQADPKNLFPVRKLALLHSYMAETHEEILKTGTSADASRQAARESYRRALDLFANLKTQGALTEKDREFVEKLQAALQRLGG